MKHCTKLKEKGNTSVRRLERFTTSAEKKAKNK
jgi:hypothetical protein